MSSPSEDDVLFNLLMIGKTKRPPAAAPPPSPPTRIDVQKAGFEKRWAALEPEMTNFDGNWKKVGSFDYAPEPLKNARLFYEAARARAQEAEARGDYQTANTELDTVEQAMRDFDDSYSPESANAKTAYLRDKNANQPKIDRYAQNIAAQAYGNPPHKDFAPAIDVFVTGKQRMDEGENAGNFLNAKLGLQTIIAAAFPQFTLAEKSFDTRWQKLTVAANGYNQGITDNTYAGVADSVLGYYEAARDSANQDVPTAKQADHYAAAHAAADTFETAMKNLSREVVLAMPTGDKKALSDARAKVMAMREGDPNVLKALAEDENGRTFLDNLVKDLGGSAKTKPDKDFVKAAIEDRYDVKFTKDSVLSTKALPRFYEVMKELPEHQTRGNPMLKEIQRVKQSAFQRLRGADKRDSTYSGGKIFINVGRTGSFRGDSSSFDQDPDVLPECKITEEKVKVKEFDATTLHEIGHSVDDSLKIMDKNQNKPEFGEWKTHSVDEVAEVGCSNKDFYADYKARYPKPFLKDYLKKVLLGQDDPSGELGDRVKAVGSLPTKGMLLAHPAVVEAEAVRAVLVAGWDEKVERMAMERCQAQIKGQKDNEALMDQVLKLILVNTGSKAAGDAVAEVLGGFVETDNPSEPDWAGLANHKAVDWAKNVRLKGTSALYGKGGAGAQKYAIGGERVYQQSISKAWVSYALSARKMGVSAYQFNAPAEWFAELYSAYYMKSLPKTHPMYNWITENVHKKQSP
jgi:hypothetical protein